MERALIVRLRGRLTDSRHIELAEPLAQGAGEVEVMVVCSGITPTAGEGESVFDVIERLPGGLRSKEDIDRQIREERQSWGTP
jgi:hypothetical protein